ncbi:MAG: hypothetical protein IPP72_08015 [Chitinophagaceae bacterium]|nr:hypothetical protein [Chitinophagaceae bacterium]
MQAYISISFSRRQLLNAEVQAIIELLHRYGIKPFVFVDHYSFDKSQEQQMMLQAFADIDQSGFLIAETSEKAIGIGVEVGYAKGKTKPVIYLRKSIAEHSTTVAGASDYQVVYGDIDDLRIQLRQVLEMVSRKYPGYRYK